MSSSQLVHSCCCNVGITFSGFWMRMTLKKCWLKKILQWKLYHIWVKIPKNMRNYFIFFFYDPFISTGCQVCTLPPGPFYLKYLFWSSPAVRLKKKNFLNFLFYFMKCPFPFHFRLLLIFPSLSKVSLGHLWFNFFSSSFQ